MITITTTEGVAYIPDNWHEVTLEGFYRAYCANDVTLLIEGESPEAIELAKPYSVLMFDSVEYSLDGIDLSHVIAKFNRMKWHKFLALEFAIQAENAGQILSIFEKNFTAEQINEMPCTVGVKPLTDLLNAYHGFLSNYRMTASITPEMQSAGIDELNKLGVWISIQEISEAYGLDPDTVLGWNIEKVYTDLFVRYKKSEYRNNLQMQNK